MKSKVILFGLFISFSGYSGNIYAQDQMHPSDENLKVALDVGLPPFAFTTPSGETTGFSYDLASLIAERLGRPGLDVVDTNFGSIFAGLFANRYEMVAAPVNLTAERAEQMLFSEPYMPTGLAFITKKGTAMNSTDDLQGKTIAVNSGGVSDTWASENSAGMGFEVQRYNKNADAVQAVIVGRAFAQMGDTPISRYIATQTPQVEVAFDIDSGRQFGFAFRKDDNAFRDEVERVLECAKLDGSLAAIYEKWFGSLPPTDSSTAVAYKGFGYEAFPGFLPSDVEPACP